MKKTRILRIFSVIITAALLLPIFTVHTSAGVFESNMPVAPKTDDVGAAYVYNIENQKELLSFNPDVDIYPASLTKLMSFLLVSEKLSSRLDETVTVTKEMLKGTTGTYVGIEAGEIFTVRQLMYAAFCGGYNDAVNVLACVCSGDVEQFVTEMNSKSRDMGMKNSLFTNPTGIHNKSMVTTVLDLAILCKAASADNLIMQVTGTEKYEIPKDSDSDRYMIYNRNRLVTKREGGEYFSQYAKGLNAGSTNQGGECVATVAEKDGLSYIIIVMGGEELKDSSGEKYISSYKVAKELIDWSLTSFGYVKLFDSKIPAADIDVSFSSGADKLSVVPTEEITMYLPLSFDPQTKLSFKMKLDSASFEAPIKKGEIVGSMAVMYRDELIGEVKLATTGDVSRDEFIYALEEIKKFSQNRIFLMTLLFALIYTLLYSISCGIIRAIKKSKTKKRI